MDAETEFYLWLFFLLGLLVFVIVVAIIVAVRQKRGLSGKPFENPYLEKARIALNTAGQVGSAILGILFLLAIGWSTWDEVTSSGLIAHSERVLTDMNSQWLQGEQKLCLYFKMPTEEAATLKCENLGNSGFRNIPVKFYGGPNQKERDKKQPDRSAWKCVRDGDRFVCSDRKILATQ